jgi:hypothetical protein
MVSCGPASEPSSVSGRDEDRQRAVEAHEAAQLARRDGVVDAEAGADVVAAQQRPREHDDLAVVLEAHLRPRRAAGGSRGNPRGTARVVSVPCTCTTRAENRALRT